MSRSGCEMGTPTTVELPESSFGLGVTLRLVADTRPTGARRVPLPVAFVALTTLDLRLGLCSTVGRERLADVVGLLEFTRGAASDEPLVCSRVDQLTLGSLLPTRSPLRRLFRHRARCAISVPDDELDSP